MKHVAWQKIKEGWKAVVAILTPIAFGAAVEMIAALEEWVATSGSIWSGVVIGVLSGVGVWLKRNAPIEDA